MVVVVVAAAVAENADQSCLFRVKKNFVNVSPLSCTASCNGGVVDYVEPCLPRASVSVEAGSTANVRPTASCPNFLPSYIL